METDGFFVTGTDTNIGKTVVSMILTLGVEGYYWKPIQSGLSEQTDRQFVSEFVGEERTLPEAYRLQRPLSPHEAALREDILIHLENIRKPAQRPLVVEGAGGLMVPICPEMLMIDLVVEFQFPVVLVARSELGTINHTLLSLHALRARGVEEVGVVLVGPIHKANRRAIEEYGNTQVVMELPPLSDFFVPDLKAHFENSQIPAWRKAWKSKNS